MAEAVVASSPLSVSVVVPVCNGGATIASCIEALLEQTYPAHLLEIIIVDNNSTDRTRSIIAGYPVIVCEEREIQTSYAARNCGIRRATGEIIALTDADCTPDRDWIENLVAPLADEHVAAVLGSVGDCASQSLVEEFTSRVHPFAHPERNALKSLITCNAAVRRAALELVGFFDERLPTGGDVDLGWRMQLEGLAIVDAPAARVRHRHRAQWRDVFAQYRRYGFSEVLLTTLHRGGAGSLTARQHATRVARQSRALASYVLALIKRAALYPWRRFEDRDLRWPLFLLMIELGNMTGKLDALIATRWFRRNPFPNQRRREPPFGLRRP